jgi:hypothetical protein
MELAALIQSVRDLIASVRAGDYFAAFVLAMDLARSIANSIPKTGKPKGMAAAPNYDGMTVEELATELEGYCDKQPKMAAKAAMDWNTIEAMLPILLALARKLWQEWLKS